MAYANNALQSGLSRARVGGSGFTLYRWNWNSGGQGIPDSNISGIMFARSVTDQSPTPVGTGTVPIHPMDSTYPEHLITPVATSMGTLTIEVYELLNKPAWGNLGGIGEIGSTKSATDLAEIFSRMASASSSLTVSKHLFKPKEGASATHTPERTGTASGFDEIKAKRQIYHNCVVSQVMDGETVEVGTMDILKQIVVNYTHYTRGK